MRGVHAVRVQRVHEGALVHLLVLLWVRRVDNLEIIKETLSSPDPNVLQWLPVCEEEEEEVGGGESRVEEQKKREGVPLRPREGDKDRGSLHLLSTNEDEEEEFAEAPERSPIQRQKNLEDPDYQIPLSVQSERRKPRRSCSRKASSHLTLRVCMLEDSQINMLSKNVLRKYPVRKVKCPLGLQEPNFLGLLKTTFPQLAGDNQPFDTFAADRFRTLRPLKLEKMTGENIHKTLKSTGAGRSALYIRLKAEQEHLHPPQQADNVISVSSTPLSYSRSETSQIHNEESDSRVPQDRNFTKPQQQRIGSEEDDVVDGGVSDPANGDHNSGRDQKQDDSAEPIDRGDDGWKQNESDEDLKENENESWSPKTARKRCIKQRGQGAKSRKSVEMSQEESIKQNNPTLACRREVEAHRRIHMGGKSFCCSLCGKSLSDLRSLSHHMLLHRGEKCHSCKPYICNVCGKACSVAEHLRLHMRTHTGERPYKCTVCLKDFTQSHCLKTHMKIHQAGESSTSAGSVS
ncbi:zinc finger protein 165-like [Lampris incognitus]|uniref:zinc finger protein 165-like n=1 Tax=Lampris incognitus TaxID=2546036 RepID=UPI0024B5B3A6|nr:zinc finger protein 165-like [Lampris incognitus]